MQDITEAAGAPKGSFYNHFASKEALGAAAVDAYAAKMGSLAVLEDRTVAPLTRLRRHFVALAEAARYPYDTGCLLGNFGAELSGQSPLIRERVAAALAHWAKALGAVVEEAQREGALPRDRDPRTLASFLINSWEGAVLRAKIERDRAPLDAFLAIVFARVLA